MLLGKWVRLSAELELHGTHRQQSSGSTEWQTKSTDKGQGQRQDKVNEPKSRAINRALQRTCLQRLWVSQGRVSAEVLPLSPGLELITV